MPACPPFSLSLPSTVHPQTCLVFINTLRLNSRWDLAFLSPALHAQMAPLQSSWVPQPCSHLWHHFSVQSMFKSSLFNCADLLPCFVWPPAYQGRSPLSPEELFLETWPALLQPYSFRGHIPCHSFKLSKPSLLMPCPGLGSCYFSFSSEQSELHHPVFAAAKTLIFLTSSLKSV